MVYHVALQIAAKSDVGLIRLQNEDAIAHNADAGLVILADGMGGYNAGEVASAIATSTLRDALEGPLQARSWETLSNHGKFVAHLLVQSIERANAAILETARSDTQYSGMGTTLVAAVFHQDKITVAHVGDSRAYRLRRKELTLITHDHSLLQEQIDAGLVDAEWARFSANRNLITRAVGVDHGVDVEVRDHTTQMGDLYLLCSDGLSDMLSQEEISDIVNAAGADLDAACSALVDRANQNGGRDNTSVILIRVQSSHGITRRPFRRALNWINDKINAH